MSDNPSDQLISTTPSVEVTLPKRGRGGAKPPSVTHQLEQILDAIRDLPHATPEVRALAARGDPEPEAEVSKWLDRRKLHKPGAWEALRKLGDAYADVRIAAGRQGFTNPRQDGQAQ